MRPSQVSTLDKSSRIVYCSTHESLPFPNKILYFLKTKALKHVSLTYPIALEGSIQKVDGEAATK